MFKFLSFVTFSLSMMASPLLADMVEVSSHGKNYSINLTSEFCHEPDHPVAIERGKMQSVVKKPLLVFLKCGDEFSGIEGWISSYSKKIQGDDTKNQIALNNEYLSGFGLIKSAEHFENLASEFPDNKIIKDLNSKLKDNLSIENWSINERKILSVESDHIIIANKIESEINGQSKEVLLLQASVAKAPSFLFINIRLPNENLNSQLLLFYGDFLAKIAKSIVLKG